MHIPVARLAIAWWRPAGAGQNACTARPSQISSAPVIADPQTAAAASCIPCCAIVSPSWKPQARASGSDASEGSAL
jgi:hypothetical protein